MVRTSLRRSPGYLKPGLWLLLLAMLCSTGCAMFTEPENPGPQTTKEFLSQPRIPR